MQRINIHPRHNWQKKVEELGFAYHTLNDTYWDESAYYQFSMAQVDELEAATTELYDMCLEAVQHVIDHKRYDQLFIPKEFVPLIENSWEEDHPAIYSRFDLAYDGIHPPKMLEYNADTPTSLFEASIIQWFWLQDINPNADQFNSIHEKLIAYWTYLKEYLHPGKLYFACVKDNMEDLVTTEYLRDCAMQGTLDTAFIYMEDIGYYPAQNSFIDLDNQPIQNIFKLYPWEWMVHEEFGPKLLMDTQSTYWIEPAWKMILSNKGILPILWELYPYHKNLLPAYFNDLTLKGMGDDYVEKPILSREGANIRIVQGGQTTLQTDGDYGEEGFIYQKLNPLPEFDGNYAVIGSWIVGQEPAGIGIRESNTLITDNTSRFVPHLISG